MATPAQIEEQIQLERDAIRCGIERFTKTQLRLKQESMHHRQFMVHTRFNTYNQK